MANAAPLRWTPGPDELRLPSEGDEPTPKTSRQSLAIAECAESLRLHWFGRQDVFVGSDQFLYWDRGYDPEADSANPPPSPHVYGAFGVANRLRESYVRGHCKVGGVRSSGGVRSKSGGTEGTARGDAPRARVALPEQPCLTRIESTTAAPRPTDYDPVAGKLLPTLYDLDRRRKRPMRGHRRPRRRWRR